MSETSSPGPVIDCDTAAALMAPLTELVVRAGAAILAVNRGTMATLGKADGSPVTEADMAADRIIGDGLARLVPDVPVLSEERAHLATPHYDGSFFLIDPLDGTKEFVAGRGAERLITGGASGRVAEPIHTRPTPQAGDPWIVAVSRSHGDTRTEAFIDARPGAVRQMLGSAVKFGRVAEGAVDIYPRLAPTCEWDVAAGHAVVTAAGGKVTDRRGGALHFGTGRKDFIVPEFIAWGDPTAVG
jgi:3'(2'), 5'-bisphosphate nucleotidase